MAEASVDRTSLFLLVDERRGEIRRYLEWALENERRAIEQANPALSMRMENRPDIHHAEDAAASFPEKWWGVVVFTCFGSKLGAEAVAPFFQRPLPPEEAAFQVGRITFDRGSVGHHRIQSTLKGANQALVSACASSDFLRSVLHSRDDFETRYQTLRLAHLRQWGRTTCFDLLLRAGTLAVGGQRYLPGLAYLAGSTGPAKGFAAIFGVPVNDGNASWAEDVLRVWTNEWHKVASRVGVGWDGEPLYPRDHENFFCIYQEQLRRGVAPPLTSGVKRHC